MSNDTPFMRWHVDAYLGDTGHLTCIEHGAYTQILWASWKRGGSVPERHLCRLVGMNLDEWAESRDTLAEFFDIADGLWTHRKIIEEIDHVSTRRDAAKRAGKASGRARNTPESTNDRSTGVEQTFNGRSTDVQRSFNSRSTNVQRSLNKGSTDAQRNPNYEEEEEEEELDQDKDSYPHSSGKKKKIGSSASFLARLVDFHGYDPSPKQRQDIIQQARQWLADGVDTDELDYAVTTSRERFKRKGDTGDPPATYLAKVIAGNRAASDPIPAGRKNTTDNAALAAELKAEMMGDVIDAS